MKLRLGGFGQAGIIKDASELPHQGFTDGANVRFRNDRVESVGYFEALANDCAVDPYGLMSWNDEGTYYWFYADGTSIYSRTGTTEADVTSVAGTYTGGATPLWSGGILGGVPIMNHDNTGNDYPQSWDGTANFEDLPNWPASTYAKIIRPFRGFLVALDIQTATRAPFTVRWSHPADPGSVPSSWDISDPSTLAGEYYLSDTNGYLVDCLQLGDMNIVYKDDSTWLMRLVGGRFVFTSERAFRTTGLIAPNCVVEFFKKHFVVSYGDIIVHNGGQIDSIIDKKNRDYLFNDLDNTNFKRSFVVNNFAKNEIWYGYPENGETACTKAAVWNYKDDTWTFIDLPWVVSGGHGVAALDAAVDTFDASSGVTFDNDTGIFGDSTYSDVQQEVILGYANRTGDTSSDGMLFGIDKNQHNVDFITDFPIPDKFIERLQIPIAGQDQTGRAKIDIDSVKFIRNIYPQIEILDTSDLDGYADPHDGTMIVKFEIFIGTQMEENEDINWHGPYTVVSSAEGTSIEFLKIDLTVAARYISFKGVGESKIDFRFKGMVLDVDVIGEW